MAWICVNVGTIMAIPQITDGMLLYICQAVLITVAAYWKFSPEINAAAKAARRY